MSAKIIAFPGNAKPPDPVKREKKEKREEEPQRRALLTPSMEMDRELDRALRGLDRDDPIREQLAQGTDSVAFSNVFRLLRRKPDQLVVFCNTLPEPSPAGVPWGDVFCLTDPETYRYIFTLYTDSYVQECRVRRGERIEPSPENIILPVPGLRIHHLTQGVETWVAAYYPGLAGIPVRLEDPETVYEMVQRSLEEDPDS